MSRFSRYVLTLAIFAFNNAQAASPVVLVEHQGKYQGYFERPRLGLVVSQFNSTSTLYWPAAKLFKVDVDTKLKLEQQRTELLTRLAALKQEYQQDSESDLAASVEKLERDISTWELAGHVALPLDPDRVRAKKSLNPLLSEGQYKLTVSERPKTILLEGLVEQRNTPLLNDVSIDTYLKHVSILAGGSNSFLYVAPASGKFYVAETGLWNKIHQEVLPGTVLFIPFEQRQLPGAFSDINKQVVELLLHKVVAP
jgi:Capsule biosynthesis GfcC